MRRVLVSGILSAGALALATLALRGLGVASPTTVALTYLLVVLFASSSSPLAVAVAISLAAMLSLNFFFMAPVGTFTIADPQNWVALVAFLVVAVVASHLSSTARARAEDAGLPTFLAYLRDYIQNHRDDPEPDDAPEDGGAQ
jgi:two-component system sensor histidine kinase KdpD